MPRTSRSATQSTLGPFGRPECPGGSDGRVRDRDRRCRRGPVCVRVACHRSAHPGWPILAVRSRVGGALWPRAAEYIKRDFGYSVRKVKEVQMQDRSPAVRGVASLLALCGAGVAFSATFAPWFNVAWNTGGADVTLSPASFSLYRLNSPFPPAWNSVALALILSGVAMLVVSAVAIPLRFSKVSGWAPVSLLLGVILVPVGSLTVQRPELLGWTPFQGLPGFVSSVTPISTRGAGLWMSLLGVALGVAALLVLEVAPRHSHRHSASWYPKERTAAVGA
jgi:hypothetical protein